MNNLNQALQIVSIQHELSMNIGLDMHLETMLSKFMKRLLQRLSLRSVRVFYNFEWCVTQNNSDHRLHYTTFSFPECAKSKLEPKLASTVEIFFKDEHEQLFSIEIDSFYYYLVKIPSFGMLLLKRQHVHIDPKILDAILPLMQKLSISCTACVQHENLVEEIDSRVKAEKQLVKQSMIDSLTGLANRKRFNLELEKAIDRAERTKKCGAIFVLDLDRFKIVNDSLGHAVGDQVLVEVSERLLSCTRQDDIVARLGGDEFCVLTLNLHLNMEQAKQKALVLAEKLNRVFDEPLEINDQLIKVSVSIGVQLYPLSESINLEPNSHQQKIMQQADLAMYSIKRNNRDGHGLYNKEVHAHAERRSSIEKALRDAIKDKEFAVHYQAIQNKDSMIIGAEALLRWNSKTLGFVSPIDFIQIAEECGEIISIGQWVLEHVCQLFQTLQQSPDNQNIDYISVNISPVQFIAPRFAENFLDTLQSYDIKPENIRIEITESIALSDLSIAIEKMQDLVNKGVSFMLDDFGSGYSSLSYIHKLPLQTVKIDRSFISQINDVKNNQVIVNAIIDISNHFNLECIAEGVETESEKQYLISQGVKKFQGYLFSRPIPQDEFLQLLTIKQNE